MGKSEQDQIIATLKQELSAWTQKIRDKKSIVGEFESYRLTFDLNRRSFYIAHSGKPEVELTATEVQDFSLPFLIEKTKILIIYHARKELKIIGQIKSTQTTHLLLTTITSVVS